MKKTVWFLVLIFVVMLLSTTYAFADTPYASANVQGTVALYSEPSASSKVLGFLPYGTKVEVLGDTDNWKQICLGEFTAGYVRGGDLLMLSDERIDLTGMPEIGYVVVNLSPAEMFSKRYQLPDANASVIDIYSAKTGNTFDLLAVLDGWCQVRTNTDTTIGFIQTGDIDIYTFEELINPDLSLRLENGTYEVNNDIPSGLYTFHSEKSADSIIELTVLDTQLQTYRIPNDSHYTLYLPPNATITIPTGGYLSAMENAPVINEETDWQYSGSGRFIAGIEIPAYNVRYTVSLEDESKSAYYEVTNLSNIYASELQPQRIEVHPEEDVEVAISRGEFLLFVNCIITVNFPQG